MKIDSDEIYTSDDSGYLESEYSSEIEFNKLDDQKSLLISSQKSLSSSGSEDNNKNKSPNLKSKNWSSNSLNKKYLKNKT